MKTTEALCSEIEYLKDYIERTFGQPLNEDVFKEQLTDMIKQKVSDYLFQRYRDWTAPQLLALMDHWNVEVRKPQPAPQVVKITEEAVETPLAKRRGRKPKELNGQAET